MTVTVNPLAVRECRYCGQPIVVVTMANGVRVPCETTIGLPGARLLATPTKAGYIQGRWLKDTKAPRETELAFQPHSDNCRRP